MSNKKIVCGVTGGIGSGKSTVCAILQNMGFPVFYADTESKLLCDTDKLLKQELQHAFGNSIYTSSGLLNRQAFASIIFSDNEKLQIANQIIHPAVRKAFQNWVSKQKSIIVCIESAILLQSELQYAVDKVLLVTANENIRLRRVMMRDSVTEKQVRDRMGKQQFDEITMKKAHYIIVNDNNELLIPQIEQFVTEIKLL